MHNTVIFYKVVGFSETEYTNKTTFEIFLFFFLLKRYNFIFSITFSTTLYQNVYKQNSCYPNEQSITGGNQSVFSNKT